jgi:hypothetical protein
MSGSPSFVSKRQASLEMTVRFSKGQTSSPSVVSQSTSELVTFDITNDGYCSQIPMSLLLRNSIDLSYPSLTNW